MTPSPMETLLTQLTQVFTTLIGLVADVWDVIVANPIALLPVGIVLAYVIVKFAKMILGIR